MERVSYVTPSICQHLPRLVLVDLELPQNTERQPPNRSSRNTATPSAHVALPTTPMYMAHATNNKTPLPLPPQKKPVYVFSQDIAETMVM